MNNMKTLKYIFLLVLVVGTFNSCFEDNTIYEQNDDGPNMVGFRDPSVTLGAVADGNEYTYVLPVKVFGPTLTDVKSVVTATIGVDESSTAIEGTHFRLDNPTITFDPDNNLLNNFEVTMLTEGIEAPLDEAPVLVLKVTDVSGSSNVVASGKTISITLNYGCFSNLAGIYSVVVVRTNYDGVVTEYPAYEEEIKSTGIGEYRTSYIGHYIPTNGYPDGLGAGTEGFSFNDVCDVLSVPLQNLNDYYSNEVSGTDFGAVDPETGVLTLKYQITFAAGIRSYVSVYTPVP
jgi:hypothetical protein